MIFGEGGVKGGPDWGWGSGGNGKEPDGTGSWGQECQMVSVVGDSMDRRARLQLLGVVGQEGSGAGG